jgi:tetratricopeptide (TPR) repeat protein
VAFILIALALPALLVVGAELVARGLGFGGYPPTFRTVARFDNGDALVSSNAESSQAYFFRNRDLPGTLSETTLRDPKPEGTFRVFLVGGSAIKGFPQIPAFSPGAFLEAMLDDAIPDRDAEVINLGTTAVASFPVLQMMTEALRFEPDLVVVYSGHNEFFGAYGVASLNTVARSPGLIALQHALRRVALVQAVDRLVAGGGGAGAPSGRLLMEVMMASPYTGPDDPIRDAAARNLGAHVRAMAERCASAGVPVIVCTLPSNERGLAPLGTSRLDALPPDEASALFELLERAPAMIEADPAAAIAPLEDATRRAPDHARAQWLLGTALHAAGRHDEAADRFARSVDLDPMPWRASSAQNDAIVEAASAAGATLCDMRAAFRDAAEGGSVGWDLMDDHVHMSLRGQALVARTIVDTLTRVAGEARVDPARAAALPGWEDYALRLGDNPFERWVVAYRMRRLFDVPFFSETNAHAIDLMDGRMAALSEAMRASDRAALDAWTAPEVNRGFQRPASSVVGLSAQREGHLEDAARLYFTTLRAMPPYTTPSIEYAFRYVRTLQMARGELDERARAEARAALERAELMIANSPEPQHTLHRHAGALLKVLGDHAGSVAHLVAARPGFGDVGLVELDQTLVHSLLQAGELDRAREVAAWGAANAGPYAGAYRQMADQIEATAAAGAGGEPGTGPEGTP